jgi:hypothetical protein
MAESIFLCETCKNWILVQESKRLKSAKDADDDYEWMECATLVRGVFNGQCDYYEVKDDYHY